MGGYEWYKKRFQRIFIPYTLAQIPFWGFLILQGDFGLLDSLYEFSTLAYWIRHTGMWYVALLIPLYLLTPYLYRLLQKTGHRYMTAAILMTALLLLCNIEVNAEGSTMLNIVKNIQFAFVRTVSFIWGMAIAPDVKAKKKVNAMYVVLATIIAVPLLHFAGFDYYWSLSAIMILCFCKTFDILAPNGKAYTFLNFMGVISLESYLFNGYVRYMFMDTPIYTSKHILLYGHYLEYAAIFIIGIILSYLVNALSAKLIEKLK